MSLAADPSVTFASAGNILATSTSISASASNSGNIVDFSANKLGGWIQVTSTGGGTVASTNGCQVQVFAAGDTTPNYDTIPVAQFTITNAVSTTNRQSCLLPTGKYSVKLTNLDASNSITAGISSAYID